MAEVGTLASAADWTENDRLAFTASWNDANCINLMRGARGAAEYRTIRQRAFFYDWFDQIREVQGHTILWPAAAWIVALQMSNTENLLRNWLISDEMEAFAAAGNKAIFDDVFPRLAEVFQDGLRGRMLTGEAAREWDRATLHHEQFDVVDPIYAAHLSAHPELLDEMTDLASGRGIFAAGGVAIGFALDFSGDIRRPNERFRHGMSVVVPFYLQFKNAIDASRRRRQRSRPDPSAHGMIRAEAR